MKLWMSLASVAVHAVFQCTCMYMYIQFQSLGDTDKYMQAHNTYIV